MSDLIIYNAGQLVTCATGNKPKRGEQMDNVGIINNGAVVISDGKIVAISDTDYVLANHSSENMVDAQGKVVMPGFVDPHTHIVFAGDRLNEFELKIKGAEYLEILANGGGIISTVKNTRSATENELVSLALKRLDKMLSCGTTTCEIKTGYGLNTETELKMLRVIEKLDLTHVINIVPSFLAAHTVPPEYKDNSDAYVDLICDEMLPKAWQWYQNSHFARNNTPFFVDVFCERNAFTIDQAKLLFKSAQSLGFRIKAHVDQFTNLGGSQLGIDLNAASIDHLDAISDEEIAGLANSETVGVVIPTENFSGGKTQFAAARKFIDSGCAVAISTDYNPGSAPCPSMPMAMAISCRYQKLTPTEALNASTINAAFSIGLGESVGSIEINKSADLIISDVSDYRAIAYEFGISPIEKVFIKGKLIKH